MTEIKTIETLKTSIEHEKTIVSQNLTKTKGETYKQNLSRLTTLKEQLHLINILENPTKDPPETLQTLTTHLSYTTESINTIKPIIQNLPTILQTLETLQTNLTTLEQTQTILHILIAAHLSHVIKVQPDPTNDKITKFMKEYIG